MIDYLDTGADLTAALHSRALVVFSLMFTTVLLSAELGPDELCLDFLEPILCDALKVNPDEVAPVSTMDAVDRTIPSPRPDMRSILALETIGAIAASGYSRATISRIARRANCSPGLIYKIYPSKDELVFAAIRSASRELRIAVSTFCDILDEGSLAQLLSASASSRNGICSLFSLEIALASSANAKFAAAVQVHWQNLKMPIPFVSGLDDAERFQLGCMIRVLALLSLSAGFLSTVSMETEKIDFNQFAEPLRRTLVKSFPSWGEIKGQLLGHVDPPERRSEYPRLEGAAFQRVLLNDPVSESARY